MTVTLPCWQESKGETSFLPKEKEKKSRMCYTHSFFIESRAIQKGEKAINIPLSFFVVNKPNACFKLVSFQKRIPKK